MLTVTKKFNFCYGHSLPNYNGLCVNQHGHNSEVEVEVMQAHDMPDAYPSMVVDFRDLKVIIEPILEQLDHLNLNEALPAAFIPPTAENIVQWFVGELLKTPIGPGISRVRISETPTSWAEWRR